MRLAIDGGPKAVTQPLPIFRTIGGQEMDAATTAMYEPLSGYLGGELTGGRQVEKLEYEFAGILGVRHAVAVNSATSGLLAACVAVGLSRGSRVLTTPYTMSATAAAPKFLGADVVFGDIEPKTFSLATGPVKTDTVIITNLFGHPAQLHRWAKACRALDKPLIEDNAQSPFAMEDGKYAGTIGDIGVFSFNVHKHLQCGEGGICVTNNAFLANRMRLFRNHGELDNDSVSVGLNLRMTEVTAAIALAQLQKRKEIIDGRVELAEELTHMASQYGGLFKLPTVREGCKHVYYCWPLLLDRDRDYFVRAMVAEGVPLRAGYVTPLYRMPAFTQDYDPTYRNWTTTENVESRIALFEVCAWDPSGAQRKQMKEAFKKVCETMLQKKEVAA